MSGRAPEVLVVVAASGLGHFRRVVAVADELIRRGRPAPHVTIVAEGWPREQMRGWAPLDAVERAGTTWIDGVVAPGFGAVGPGVDLEPGRFVDWERRLTDRVRLDGYDLVVSDNLTGVLHHRPDAVLMGSFLWSDVLEPGAAGRTAILELVERERAILDAVRPPMICVDDMAMPGVRNRTRAIGVGWMCEPMAQAAAGADRVAVVGGRTGAADAALGDVVATLVAAGVDVVADPALLAAAPGATAFDYEPSSWSALGAVVARPGMGTLTECVGRRIPVVSVHEPDNPELDHNGRRVEALGIGRDLGSGGTPADVADCVTEMLADRSGTMRKAFEELNTSGLGDTATWLAGRLGIELVAEGAGRPDGAHGSGRPDGATP